MKNTFKLSILLITTLLLLIACSNKSNSTSSSNKETITVENTYEFKDQKHTHSSGESKTQKVKVPVDPDRIAVLDYGALDIMQQMGLQDKVVSIAKGKGASFLSSSLSEFKDSKYPNLGNPGRPNYDTLAKSKPDVIFASFRQAHTETLDEMKKAAPNAKILFVSPNNNNYIHSIKDHTTLLGKIFKKENKAKELNNQLSDKVNKTKEVINNDTVLFLNVDDKGIKAFGSTGRFGGFLNKDLGIQHADKNMKENSAGNTVTYEYLNKVNPDKLMVIDRTKNGDDKTLPSVLDNDVIKNMKAVKNDQIYQFETNAWYFSEGGINTTIEQLDKIEKAFKK
ncbi:transferrin-binding protein [Staphylococcus devriesei]|uniref:Transferrin-binding protein n=1 Tax=Staphylococcus devriesei TaxID=586733 RepID=A0A2T4KQN8_9STAP|nr:ABC transporter substrate-binding protein [Staphylococcus devriesei]PTF04695.1 transferrin-binding protein [Staphylococcus devriesei]PTF15862.1 transferrin-binding protein [Staphylococcus devriesei]